MELPAAKRYEYFVKKVADRQELWSLKASDGWVMASDQTNKEVFPIWPHSRFAEACAKDNWHGCTPQSIALKDWLAKWIPGLSRDQRAVAVFPTTANRGVVVSPEKLRADLIAECEKYEDD
jgi:hypothetical protein